MFKILKEIFLNRNRTTKTPVQRLELTRSFEHNVGLFEQLFEHDDTLIYRELETLDRVKCMLIFADGMVNRDIIHKNIIAPIIKSRVEDFGNRQHRLGALGKKIIVSETLEPSSDVEHMVSSILYGDSVLLVEGEAAGLVISTKGWSTRAVSEPISENVVRGPREGFTESLAINITLVRRKILDAKLKFQFRELGTRSKTKICVTYIEGLASDEILKELNKRLDQIELDAILESGYIEEFIKDSPLTPFKTVGFTERPDIVAAKILEGRVAVMVDGTPFVLTLPFLFMENFQANEDYYKNFILSSIYRFSRYIAFVLTTATPAVYLSLVTYHQEMIPTPLLLSISASRQGVPFPTVLEAIGLGFVFELLREGGVRLPSPIGQAISIVGAIILGDAAVRAKLVSAPMIIITSLTGISGFLIPGMFGLSVIFRLTLLLLASFFGLYGILFGVIGFFIQVMSMRSFGVPYLLHWGDVKPQDLKDTALRAPWWYMRYRPRLIGKRNSERQSNSFPPERK